MKKIEAIVRHHKVEEIKAALVAMGMYGMTITEVRGYGRQKGQSETYRGAEYKVDFIPKVKVEIAATEANAQKVIDAILNAASTGKIGDGKIFVTSLADGIRIRTRETGDNAL